MRDPIRITYWVTILLLAILGVYAAINHMVYVADAAIFITLATLFYAFRERVLFSWEGVLLCCAGMLMNTSGALGAYNLSVNGIGWDKFLHIVTTTGIGIVVYAYLAKRSPSFSPLALAVIVFFFVMGVGALNEITEFIGTRYFGFGQGILGMTNGDVAVGNDLNRFDTHFDMIANAVGALVAVVYTTLRSSSTNVKRKQARASR